MELAETLKQLGMDEKQAKVYLAALELGSATIQELADKSGVKRTSIYNFLDEMKHEGLVSEFEANKKLLIIAADPHSLVKRAERQAEKTKNILPDLMAIFNQPGEKSKVRYFEGTDGIIKAYDDMLITGEDIYAYSDLEKLASVMTERMWDWPIKRAALGIRFHGIAKAGPWSKFSMARNKEELREMKLIEDVDFETEINIYGNKVAMVSFRRPYACVIIEDRAIVQTLRSAWKLLWVHLPESPTFDKADYLEYPNKKASDSSSARILPQKRPGKN